MSKSSKKKPTRKKTSKHPSSNRSHKKIVEKKTVKAVKIAWQHKIHLEKSTHTYRSVLYRRYFKHLKRFQGPLKVFMVLIKMLGLAISLLALFVITLFLVFGRDLPNVQQLKGADLAETTHIYDRSGHELYRIFGQENREYVKLTDINQLAINATISIEDKNFYRHFGFDPIGIIRAQLKNIQDDSISQGASTITQQLAKNIFLSSERTYERKIKELLLALELEWNFSKDQILELYFNKIAYGSNAFGIEAAAQTFFGVPAKNVSLVQASVLASLPKAPSYFSPYGSHLQELIGYCKTEAQRNENQNPFDILQGSTEQTIQEQLLTTSHSAATNKATLTKEPVVVPAPQCASPWDPKYVWGRKDFVLQRLVEDSYISRDQMVQAWKDGFQIKFIDLKHKIEDPHFVFYVKDLLEQRYGKDLVENGGLQVITTLDPQLQKTAEKAIAGQIDLIHSYGANNAGLVALDPKNGQVLAMVGSLDYWNNEIGGQVNVTLSPRQPGSSFKPLVYAAAIQNAGVGSGTYIGDYKTLFNKHNIPKNYDGAYLGNMTMRTALGGSRNIPAIKAYYIAGEEEKVLDFVDKVGVTELRSFRENYNKIATANNAPLFYYGWPMAIGSGEVQLLDLFGAYGTFANSGKFAEPNPILEVRDRNGVLIDRFDGAQTTKQAMDPQVAYIINDMLSDVSARPAGSWRWLLTIAGQNVAAKTGTSNKKIGGGYEVPNNNVTIGYTPSLVAGVWVGNTDGHNLYSSAYSLYTSDPIYHDFFTEALKDKPREEFPKPDGLKWIGSEVFPSWGGPKSFESMFTRIKETQEDVPLSDFLKNTPADIEAARKWAEEHPKEPD